MSTSFNGGLGDCKTSPVVSLEYRNIRTLSADASMHAGGASAESGNQVLISLTEEDLQQRLRQAHSQGAAEAVEHLRQEHGASLTKAKAAILEAVAGFQRERSNYYSRVETELVHLSLSIAAKVLHREAQVDRTVLAGLVKVAIENLQHRTNIAIRVRPEEGERWRAYLAQNLPDIKVQVLEDSTVTENNCTLETELGTAEVGVEAQLKEIERGFFDLLAQRPDRQ
jgi:flagellar assembly protein FliH